MVKSQPDVSVDMVVQMAPELFQEKDYLDMRYFYRRAYFLAVIAVRIQKLLGAEFGLSYDLLNGNPLLPVLVLQPKADSDGSSEGESGQSQGKSRGFIRIIPCAPEGLFPTAKLVPTTCCNRPSKDDKSTLAPTPFYNSTLKAESTFITYLRVLTRAKRDCPAFADACILGRIWL